MITRFHYEDLIYQQLLNDELSGEEKKSVTGHIEECEACQTKLESMSQHSVSWEDIHTYLAPKQQTECLNSMHVNGSDSGQTASPSLSFLSPSDEENSLGRYGRFEISEVLGRGGMGVVLRGYDASLNRNSAIKVLSPELAANAAARKRESLEAKAAAAVVHEHVIPILTVDEEQGLPYLVMPVVEGRSLEQRVDSTGPMAPKEILRIGMQIASGLAAAHAQGLVHRDVKPANILLENSVERVVITDFGLARAVDDASMTRSGVITGTPQYMSPEQARGKVSNGKSSDIYSLGVIFYELLTGVQPLVGDHPVSTLLLVANTPPKSPRSQRPEIPRDLEAICLRCLEKEPNDRYATAFEIAEEIDRWSTGRPVEARTANAIERCSKWCRRNPVHCLAMTLITLAMIFATVQWIAADRQRLRAEQQAERSERNIALAGRAIRDLATRTVQSPEIPLAIRKTLGQQALDFQLQLLEEDPADVNLIYQAALLWNNVAWNLHDERHFEDSIAASQESDTLLEQLPSSNEKIVALQNSNRTLKASNQQLLGRFKEALQTLRFPHNTEEPAYVVAAGLDQQGYTLQNSGQLEKARDAFLQSVLVWENSGARKNIFAKAGLAESLHGLAWVQFDLGEYRKALANVADARRIHEELIDVIPFHENFEEQVTRVHLLLGQTQLKLKQFDQASLNLQTAIDGFERLREWNQEMPRYVTQELVARGQYTLVLLETNQLPQIEQVFTPAVELFGLLPEATVDRAEKGKQLVQLLLQMDDAIKRSNTREEQQLVRAHWHNLAAKLSELVRPILPQDSAFIDLQTRITTLKKPSN